MAMDWLSGLGSNAVTGISQGAQGFGDIMGNALKGGFEGMTGALEEKLGLDDNNENAILASAVLEARKAGIKDLTSSEGANFLVDNLAKKGFKGVSGGTITKIIGMGGEKDSALEKMTKLQGVAAKLPKKYRGALAGSQGLPEDIFEGVDTETAEQNLEDKKRNAAPGLLDMAYQSRYGETPSKETSEWITGTVKMLYQGKTNNIFSFSPADMAKAAAGDTSDQKYDDLRASIGAAFRIVDSLKSGGIDQQPSQAASAAMQTPQRNPAIAGPQGGQQDQRTQINAWGEQRAFAIMKQNPKMTYEKALLQAKDEYIAGAR